MNVSLIDVSPSYICINNMHLPIFWNKTNAFGKQKQNNFTLILHMYVTDTDSYDTYRTTEKLSETW